MDLKDLAKLADLCRKKGISQIKFSEGTVEFQLAPKPTRSRVAKGDKIDTIEPNEEDVLYWSSTGVN